MKDFSYSYLNQVMLFIEAQLNLQNMRSVGNHLSLF